MQPTASTPAAICHKCGCPLTFVHWKRGFAYCPECGEPAHVATPAMAVPFTTTLGDFKRAIAHALTYHTYVPRNVFDSVKRGTLRQVMAPVRKHSGLYRARMESPLIVSVTALGIGDYDMIDLYHAATSRAACGTNIAARTDNLLAIAKTLT